MSEDRSSGYRERSSGEGRDSSERGGYGRGGGRPDRGERRGRGGFRRARRKVCSFCVDKVGEVDYKDVGRLSRLVSERGKILKSRATGTCLRHQRAATRAIKRARHLALLPFVHGE